MHSNHGCQTVVQMPWVVLGLPLAEHKRNFGVGIIHKINANKLAEMRWKTASHGRILVATYAGPKPLKLETVAENDFKPNSP